MYGYRGGVGWKELGGWNWHIYTIDTMHKIDNSWEHTAEHREFCLMHCSVLNGREIQKKEEICICMANSFCYAVEASIVKQLYSNKNYLIEISGSRRPHHLVFTPFCSPCPWVWAWPWLILTTEHSKGDGIDTVMWYKITEPVTQVSLGPSLARKEQAAKSCGHSKKLCVASRSQRQMLGNRQQEAEALSPIQQGTEFQQHCQWAWKWILPQSSLRWVCSPIKHPECSLVTPSVNDPVQLCLDLPRR